MAFAESFELLLRDFGLEVLQLHQHYQAQAEVPLGDTHYLEDYRHGFGGAHVDDHSAGEHKSLEELLPPAYQVGTSNGNGFSVKAPLPVPRLPLPLKIDSFNTDKICAASSQMCAAAIDGSMALAEKTTAGLARPADYHGTAPLRPSSENNSESRKTPWAVANAATVATTATGLEEDLEQPAQTESTKALVGEQAKQQSILSLAHIPDLVDKLHGRETVRNNYERLIFSQFYVAMVTSAVVLQAAVLGIEVQFEMEIESDRLHGRADWKLPAWLQASNFALLVFFLLDVLFRVAVLQKRFFFPTDPDAQVWNIFDLVIVIACIPEFFPKVFENLPFVHAFRLLRVIRILRVARGLPSLRKMVFALLHCMSSLLWLVGLMFLLLYMFALAFMQGAQADMKLYEHGWEGDSSDDAARRLAKKVSSGCTGQEGPHPYNQFSNIAKSMETLFLMVTGDADWDKTMKGVMESSWFYKFLGLFFSVFFFFGFMNVATGLFVERAMQIASQDREMILRDAKLKEAQEMRAMRELFQSADQDGDGDLTICELQDLVSHPEVRSWLATIDLDIVDDFEAVARILDPDGKGYVKADEFYQKIGCFKGPARRLETTLLLNEARSAHRSFHSFHRKHNSSLDKAVTHLEKVVNGDPSRTSFRISTCSPASDVFSKNAEGNRNVQADLDLAQRLVAMENDQSNLHGTLKSVVQVLHGTLESVSRLQRKDQSAPLEWPVKSFANVGPEKKEDYGVEESLKRLESLKKIETVDESSRHVKKLSATQSRIRRNCRRNGQERTGNPMAQEQWERENKTISADEGLLVLTPRDGSKIHPSSNLLAIPQGNRAWSHPEQPRSRSRSTQENFKWDI